MAIPDIAVRSSSGVALLEGPERFTERPSPREKASSCRAMAFNPAGDRFAWTNGTSIEIVQSSGKGWSNFKSIPGPKIFDIQFSPLGKHLACWEVYNIAKGNEGMHNMYLYSAETGELIQSFVQKQQANWQPMWSSDEKIFGRLVNNEVMFYENLDFSKPAAVVNCSKVATFSLSPTIHNRSFVVCHMPGSTNLPTLCKMFRYPNFEMNQALASKGFFQGDTVQFFWNCKGTNVLFLTSTEVDKSNTTYYGKQTLHYATSKGETITLTLDKEGPIYDVAWSPKGQEFCVIYGLMPAKAVMFNLACDPVFKFGTGPRNSIYFSPNGNRVLLCGFGNLPGRMEVWDTETKKQLSTCEAPNSTGIIWDPRSECFVSFTTAPRLRVDNGFKVWHSTGALIYEYKWPSGELFEMLWQPGNFPASNLANKKPKSIAPTKPVVSKPYRPPAAQGAESSFKVHDDEEKPHLPGQVNSNNGPSKAALKQKKKREARKARKVEDQVTAPVVSSPFEDDSSDDDGYKKPSGGKTYEQKIRAPVTNDPDKDKKMKNIIKKLEAIAKLKSDVASGKPLDTNQMAKIAKENDLLKELGELNL